MAFWYFFMFAGLALSIPFVPPFLKNLGFSYTQIGQLTAISALAGFLSQNFIGAWSDRLRRRKPFIVMGSLGMATVYVVFPLFRSYNAFVLLYVAAGLATFTAMTASSALVLDMSAGRGAGRTFANARIWGSVGFVAMMALGWVAPSMLTTEMLFRATPFAYLMAGLSALVLREPSVPAVSATRMPPWAGLSLLRKPGVPILLLVAAILHACLNGSSGQLVLWMNSLHADQRIVHLTFIVSATIEIPFMLSVGRWSDRLGRRPLLAITGIALPLRLLLYSQIYDPRWIPLVQTMHGLTFSVLAVVPLAAMNDITPERQRAAGQGLLNATLALASAMGPVFVGTLSDLLGLQMMYRALAVPAAAAGFILFLFLRESNPEARPVVSAFPPSLRGILRPVAVVFDESPWKRR